MLKQFFLISLIAIFITGCVTPQQNNADIQFSSKKELIEYYRDKFGEDWDQWDTEVKEQFKQKISTL